MGSKTATTTESTAADKAGDGKGVKAGDVDYDDAAGETQDTSSMDDGVLRGQAADGQTHEEPGEPAPNLRFQDTVRANLAKLARERRDRELSEQQHDNIVEDVTQEDEPADEADAPADDPAKAKTNAEADDEADDGGEEVETPARRRRSDDVVETLIVGGRKVEMSRAELRAHYQTLVAQDEVRATAAKATTQQQEEAAAPAPVVEADPVKEALAKIDRGRLREVAKRVQLGDDEEGADAFTDLVEDAVRAAVAAQPRIDVGSEVARHHRAHQYDVETKAAIAKFQESHQDVLANKYTAKAAELAVLDELKLELVAAGVPQSKIDAAGGDIQALGAHYFTARERGGAKLRSLESMLDAAGTKIATEFKLRPAPEVVKPNPAPASKASVQLHGNTAQPRANPDRVAEKRALSQPRAVGVRSAMPTAPAPKSAEDKVRAMRQSRGQKLY